MSQYIVYQCISNLSWEVRVTSESDASKSYVVRFSRLFNWACTCKAWLFSKADPPMCKHITAVRAAGSLCAWNHDQDTDLEPAWPDGPDGEPKCPSCGSDVVGTHVPRMEEYGG